MPSTTVDTITDDTHIVVGDASNFPAPQFDAQWDGEPVRVVNGPPGSTSWTILREQGAGTQDTLLVTQFMETVTSSEIPNPVEGYEWKRDSSGDPHYEGTGSDLLVQMNSAGSGGTPYVELTSKPRDQEVRFLLHVDSLPTGDNVDWCPVVRDTGSSPQTHYRTRFRIGTSGAIDMRLEKVVAGTTTSLTSNASTGVTVAAGDDVWLCMQALNASATTVRCKIWLDTDAEPSSWAQSTTDSESTLQVGNYPGFRPNAGASITNSLPYDWHVKQFEVRSAVAAGSHSTGTIISTEDPWATPVACVVGSGAPTAIVQDGVFYFDYAAVRLYVRARGTWRYVVMT